MTRSEGLSPQTRLDGVLVVMRKPGSLALLLALLTFWLFWPALRCGFVEYDDGVYVVENLQVLKGISFEGLACAFRSIEGGSWMPLTWISHMLDVTLFGTDPAGHHFTNILLHSANGALLLLAMNRLTRRLWLSALVAAVFAWHPLRTESVVWVAERKDVLSTLMWMLGLLTYASYVERPGTSRYVRVIVCLALGLMAKPMLVTFPFVLLLLDFWPLQRLGRNPTEFRKEWARRLSEKVPLLLLVALASGATVWSQNRAGAVDRRETPMLQRAWQITSNYAFYLEKSFLPANRTVVYPEKKLPAVATVAVGVSMAALSILAVWRRYEFPWLTTGWFWFLGTLVPVIGFVPVGLTPVADRYSYIPSVGVGLAIVWGLSELTSRRAGLRRIAGGVGLFVIFACAWGTRADIRRWRDSEALFAAAARTAPHKIAFNNLAFFLVKRGDYERAIETCTRAIELDPHYGASYGNRALAYAWANDYEQAKSDYDQAVKLGARPIQPLRRLQALSGKTTDVSSNNDPEEAWHLFAGVSGLEPRSAASYRGRGDIRVKIGDVTGGIADYTKALELMPNDAATYTGRGNAHVRLGNWTNALADLTKAVELAPADARGYQNRAVVYFKIADYENAWADVERCRNLGGIPHASFLHALTEARGRGK